MKVFKRFYTKYMVKSQFLFYSLVILASTLFVVVTVSVPIDIVETYDATFMNDRIILYSVIDLRYNSIFIYKSKNSAVEKCDVKSIKEIDDKYTLLYLFDEVDDTRFEGPISVDIVLYKSNLLKLILGIDRKYVVKNGE